MDLSVLLGIVETKVREPDRTPLWLVILLTALIIAVVNLYAGVIPDVWDLKRRIAALEEQTK